MAFLDALQKIGGTLGTIGNVISAVDQGSLYGGRGQISPLQQRMQRQEALSQLANVLNQPGATPQQVTSQLATLSADVPEALALLPSFISSPEERQALELKKRQADALQQYRNDLLSVKRDEIDIKRRAEDRRASAPSKLTSSEQKIERLINNLGVDRETATKISDGIFKVAVDPVTSTPFLVDLASGTTKPLSSSVQGNKPEGIPVPSAEETPSSLYGSAESIAGVAPAALDILSRTVGQIPGVPVAGTTLENRQTAENIQGMVARAFANNPRYAEGERKQIIKDFSIEPSLVDSPEAYRARLRSIDKNARMRLKEAEKDAANPELPADYRKAQAQAATTLKQLLPRIGAPQGVAEGRIIVNPVTGERRIRKGGKWQEMK